MTMQPTVVSQQKQRKSRRDKLPPDGKHARHLEASRSYYARYFFHDHFYDLLIMPLTRNKMRIQEEQRLRTRR